MFNDALNACSFLNNFIKSSYTHHKHFALDGSKTNFAHDSMPAPSPHA